MEYKFGKAKDACERCQHPFTEGEVFISALVPAPPEAENADDTPSTGKAKGKSGTKAKGKPVKPARGKGKGKRVAGPQEVDDAEGLVRADICTACWPTEDMEQVYSWWTSYRAPKPKRAPTLDPDFLWALLDHARAIAPPVPTAEPDDPDADADRDADASDAADAAAIETANPHAEADGRENAEDANRADDHDDEDAEVSPVEAALAASTESRSRFEAMPADQAPSLAYLAALGLMRLREVKLTRHTRVDKAEVLHFRARTTGETFAVLDPNLSDETIASLESRLEDIRAAITTPNATSA